MSDETDDLAQDVLDQLDPGTIIADRVILSKQQAAAIMGGGLTLAGVLGVSAGSASAESDGVLGSDDEPIDATLGNFASEATADGYELTIDGDTYQINE